MRLHEDKKLFLDTVAFAAQPKENGGLGIRPLLIEKDYWVCRALKLMATGDKDNRAVFKGGTSLSKAYGIGARFSEDIDVAIAESWTLSGNQLKNLIRRTAHNMTEGLDEIVIPDKTSKGSRYYKAYYQYPQQVESLAATSINPGQILVEINSFANPYPFERREIQSFVGQFLLMVGETQLAAEYDMLPFTVAVLDKRRTLTEKLVSLLRCSLADDHMNQLTAKIRHFYDLYYLYADADTGEYLRTEAFCNDIRTLFLHDQEQFSKPEGWQGRKITESPLLLSFDDVWESLKGTYQSELPDLAYSEIPTPQQIAESIHSIVALLPRL